MQSRTTLLGVAALVVTLALGGVVGATYVGDGTAAQSAPQGHRTITVDAAGQVQTSADQARVSVAVVSTAPTVTTARNRLNENVSRMRDALREMGIDDGQVRTEYFDISQDYRGPDTGPTTYRATHSFQITLSNTSRAGEVIDATVSNGANRVDGVQFTLSQDKRQRLRQQALEDAMSNAKTEAETLAESGGLHVGGVATIDSSDTSYRPVQYESAALASGGGGTSVESGPVTVTAAVTVSYNATAA
ncbi:MAG: SIMPL domain-containing protein [Haloarculaceae archaeon]